MTRPRFACAIVLEVGKDRFPPLTGNLRTNRNCHGKVVPIKVVRDATLSDPFPVTSTMLWMLQTL